jgi:uncharacterized membrane protein YdjX (TVP38/TMEM64 family)
VSWVIDQRPGEAAPADAADAVAGRGVPGVRLGARWLVWIALAGLATAALWHVSDSEAVRLLGRLYRDREFLREILPRLGVLGPVLFVVIQALQVVIAPIPGELTGFLGGFLFGETLGFVCSTLGLTAGSLLAFAVGRQLGAPFVRRVVTPQVWERIGFLVKAEGVVLCFTVFLIPGVPKDITCYLFGLSPMPFWTFAVVSTLGRMPGTWALSAEGAKTATGQYLEVAILTAVLVAAALPLYYFRDRIVSRLHRARH